MRNYRAWLIKLKKLVPVDIIDFKKETIEVDYETFSFDDIILGEETGYRDVNVKSIYAGDLVEFGDSIYEVMYDSDNARYILSGEDKYFICGLGENWEREYKIVGNIYEKS